MKNKKIKMCSQLKSSLFYFICISMVFYSLFCFSFFYTRFPEVFAVGSCGGARWSSSHNSHFHFFDKLFASCFQFFLIITGHHYQETSSPTDRPSFFLLLFFLSFFYYSFFLSFFLSFFSSHLHLDYL